MCGITGAFAYRPGSAPTDADEVVRMRDRMAARGPDGVGLWRSDDGRIAFGHRRLSIIDPVATSDQPMHAFGRYTIVFNGEIYNYQELRAELAEAGARFRTHSDTEVLLHLYQRHGAEMVGRLRGMFAIAIWDAEERTLWLARDPYGIKPLYWSDDGRAFRFASQVKALLASGAVKGDLDAAGLVGACLFGHVPDPFTLHRGVRALEAGSTLLVSESGLRFGRYHRLSESLAAHREDWALDEAQVRVRDAVCESVRYHRVADVPVGAFLSGGVDSGVLVALMREGGQDEVKTFNICFEANLGSDLDERAPAHDVAEAYGARHSTQLITDDDLERSLPLIREAMDQPSVDGINTWFVSRAAHTAGLKVAFSGLGGDELFGSYPSFTEAPRIMNWCRWSAGLPGMGRAMRMAASRLQTVLPIGNAKLPAVFELGGTLPGAYLCLRGLYTPWELGSVLGEDVAEAGLRELEVLPMLKRSLQPDPGGDYARIALLEAAFYMRNQLLRDADWAGMAHSVEIRVPLVDRVLFEQLSPWLAAGDPDRQKRLLAAVPQTALPSSVTNGRKVGFGVPLRQIAGGDTAQEASRRWFLSLLAAEGAPVRDDASLQRRRAASA